MAARHIVELASVLLLVSALMISEPLLDCTTSSLQAAIDRARDGDTIMLAPGVCTENLVITKSLTLKGAGIAQTMLRGGKPGFPVIFVQSDNPITVTLSNLTLADAPKASDAPQHGKECALFYPELLCPSGLQARGAARVTLDSVRIARTPWVGVYVLDTAHVSVFSSEVLENGWGVYVSPSASVELRDSTVERSRENGLEIWGTASIVRTLIRSSGRSGVESVGTVKVFESEVVQNRGSGILLVGASQTELIANVIAQNELWGVAAQLRKCRYLSDNFRGSAVLYQNRIFSNRLGTVCLP
ncbi:MAG: right-handed parallel beta-helix repeat-containing protein [Candidatus Bipolaricaulota bacterium]|nr:right-handed parallel beta-helix repeat-containing protein [Candidatus Bipolaricaulota bacterium]MDW8030766.1 right-handed parallel beta-helix repeat-containing protein [Candidatus Bipolaricaulota bacterium]